MRRCGMHVFGRVCHYSVDDRQKTPWRRTRGMGFHRPIGLTLLCCVFHEGKVGWGGEVHYLVGATYGDGLPNNAPLWSYDPAGNRTDSVCDNLNRATSIGGATCTNDVLGNRLTKGATSYTWDVMNRMTALNNGSSTTNYAYRADGMRVSKSSTTGRTVYCYDGQMS